MAQVSKVKITAKLIVRVYAQCHSIRRGVITDFFYNIKCPKPVSFKIPEVATVFVAKIAR